MGALSWTPPQADPAPRAGIVEVHRLLSRVRGPRVHALRELAPRQRDGDGAHSVLSAQWLRALRGRPAVRGAALRRKVSGRRPRRASRGRFYAVQRYAGYGKNKLEWSLHLRGRGFAFRSVPDAFCVHVPHEISAARRTWEHTRSSHHRSKSGAKFWPRRASSEKLLRCAEARPRLPGIESA